MANTKISDLTAATTVAGADLVPIVQGGVTKKVAANLLPISTAQATINTTQATTNAAKADLVAGVIPSAQIPALALQNTQVVASQAAMLALTSSQVQPGDIAVRTDGAGTFILTATDPTVLGNWTRLNAPTDAVTSVNGQTGTVVLATGTDTSYRSKMVKARRALVASTLDFNALHIGHSITESARADAVNLRWTDIARDRIRSAFGITGGFGYVPPLQTYVEALPAPWVYTGSQAANTDGALGRYGKTLAIGAAAATASLTFTGTAIRVYYATYSGGPTVAVTIDGGAVASINANTGSSTYASSVLYTGLTAGSHTILLTNPTGQFGLNGAIVYNGDETTGYRTFNGGHSGDVMGPYLTSPASLRIPPMYTAIAPKLVTIEFMVNEYRTNISVSGYQANLAALVDQVITACPTASIVIMSDAEPLHPSTPVAPWADYKTATATVAASKNVALFDISTISGMGLAGSLMNVDQVHPSNAGHAAIGTAFADWLLAA